MTSAVHAVSVARLALATSNGIALSIDAASHGVWDKPALLRGYQNSKEIPVRQVNCPDLPDDLIGTYYRNGHARFTGYDGQKVRHPFDADGMVTSVSLDGRTGTAVVRQRYVATEGAVAERRAGRSLYPGIFGNPLPLWAGGARVKNLANTNVMYHDGKLLALYEGCRPHLIDPLSLATMQEWNVGGLVGDGLLDGFSAHPRKSPDGGVCNFASASNLLSGTTTVRFWDFAPHSFSLRAPAQVYEVPGYGIFHDFMVTKSWYILVAPPAVWGSRNPLRTFKHTLEWIMGMRPLTSMVTFDVTKKTVAHFIPRAVDSSHASVPYSRARHVLLFSPCQCF